MPLTLPLPFSVEDRERLRRSYNFNVAPATKINQFAGAVTRIGPPYFTFESAGAVIESNKFAEYTVERFDPNPNGTSFGVYNGPSSSGGSDYPTYISCQMQVESYNTVNLDDTACAGIQMSSTSFQPNLLTSADDGALRVVQMLKDVTQWQLQVRPGNGVAGVNIPFTIPPYPDGLNLTPNAHDVELWYIPTAREICNIEVYAVVDHVIRAQATLLGPGAGGGIWGLVNHLQHVGLIIFGGVVQAGASKIAAQWTGMQIINTLTHTKWGGGV